MSVLLQKVTYQIHFGVLYYLNDVILIAFVVKNGVHVIDILVLQGASTILESR
jgi:hypothetical protein